MSQNIPFYSINGEYIHKIHQLVKQKDYKIQFSTKSFCYCKEQLIFLSRKALHHFESSISPFEIQIDENNQISVDELVSSFLLLDSLLHSAKQIEINETNVNSLSLIADILNNLYLSSKCAKVSPNHPKSISFSFKQLQFISKEERESLNNISIKINDICFEVNRILFSLLSDRFSKINSNEISFSIPEESVSCFISIFNSMKGNIINFNKFNLDSVFSIFDYFGCSLISHFLSKSLSIPQTIPESIQILKHITQIDDSSPLKEHILQSISIISSSLNEVPFEILNSFSLSVLESIFSSEDLRIPDEDYLLTLISKLAEKDSNRKCLYKYILSQKTS
jgi:hypothetical protein